ncbi:MAG: SsrA-binding protein SmpB [Candidatus Xenobia bacterium]
MSEREEARKNITENRRARHDYAFEEYVEAGIQLVGTEVKSLRAGKANLTDSYARIEKGEAWLIGAHISPYEHGNRFNPDPMRMRKLLLHRREIDGLFAKLSRKGLTLIPLRMYFKDGRAKVELGLGVGKKQYDKREDIAKREATRELARVTGTRFKRGGE